MYRKKSFTQEIVRALLKTLITTPIVVAIFIIGSNVAGLGLDTKMQSSLHPSTASLLYCGTTFANCGFYTCEFILQHFGIKAGRSIEVVDFGRLMERAISFADICRMAKSAGLKCAGYSNMGSDSILALVDSEKIVVLQTLNSNGHHYLVVGKGVGNVWICDPGVSKTQKHTSKVGPYIESVSTGKVLVISREEIEMSEANILDASTHNVSALKGGPKSGAQLKVPELEFDISETVVARKTSNTERFYVAPITMNNRSNYEIYSPAL